MKRFFLVLALLNATLSGCGEAGSAKSDDQTAPQYLADCRITADTLKHSIEGGNARWVFERRWNCFNEEQAADFFEVVQPLLPEGWPHNQTEEVWRGYLRFLHKAGKQKRLDVVGNDYIGHHIDKWRGSDLARDMFVHELGIELTSHLHERLAAYTWKNQCFKDPTYCGKGFADRHSVEDISEDVKLRMFSEIAEKRRVDAAIEFSKKMGVTEDQGRAIFKRIHTDDVEDALEMGELQKAYDLLLSDELRDFFTAVPSHGERKRIARLIVEELLARNVESLFPPSPVEERFRNALVMVRREGLTEELEKSLMLHLQKWRLESGNFHIAVIPGGQAIIMGIE